MIVRAVSAKTAYVLISPRPVNGHRPDSRRKKLQPAAFRSSFRNSLNKARSAVWRLEIIFLRIAAFEAIAISGARDAKNSLSCSFTRSQGGLPITQEKPSDQPVFGSMSAELLPTRKIWGNSTCQWKKRYWRVSSATRSSAAARFSELSSAPKFSRTAWVMAVERVASVLGWTKAAHQASARSFWMRRSGDAA